MQRWKVQPDWDIKLTDDLRFSGWLAMYQFVNDLNITGYSDSRVESETGLNYTFNETVGLTVNYYTGRALILQTTVIMVSFQHRRFVPICPFHWVIPH